MIDRLRRGMLPPEKPTIALTFDDAYSDFHAVALPMLMRYELTATLYVPTGYVGGHSGWMKAAGETQRAILSWSQIEEVAAAGIEIGAHSHTHPELDRLPDRALADEVARPKAVLEDHLGRAVRSFAYPYGDYDRRVRNAVATAGYCGAVTMNSWTASAADHPLELPRITVLDDTDVVTLARRLVAGGGRARRAALRARRVATTQARRWRTPRDQRVRNRVGE
ncbi:MAG: polysaccharide deacetylase family protein [Sciscionella sp.]